jgi:hypothetical protein
LTQRCQPVSPLGSCFMDVARAMGVLVFVCAVAQSQTAFVRVNQVGYVSGASKRAYLMASGIETGATFSIKNSSDTTVFGPAAIGANLGSWSKGYPDVYALDFDSFAWQIAGAPSGTP